MLRASGRPRTGGRGERWPPPAPRRGAGADARGRGPWAAVCVVAAVLTAGSVWAAVSGGLHPGLWLLFFGGLLYAAALSLVELLRVTRVTGRGTIAGP